MAGKRTTELGDHQRSSISPRDLLGGILTDQGFERIKSFTDAKIGLD